MKATLIGVAVALLLAGGCNKSTEKTADTGSQVSASATLTPEQLGEIGAHIKKQPDDAKKILSDHGLTEESFEKEIRKVSEDPQASKRYAEAYKRAGA